MSLSRRSLITGLISLVAAPAIVRVSSLMPVKVIRPDIVAGPLYYQDRIWWAQADQPHLVHYVSADNNRAWIVQVYKAQHPLNKMLERLQDDGDAIEFGKQLFGERT
jgi:hypothetical protein